jgi:hypothetical protein
LIVSKFDGTIIIKIIYVTAGVGSAFHWIPEEIGYTKVFDMLKSGGVFARFANHPYKDKGREEIHEALQKIYSVYAWCYKCQ